MKTLRAATLGIALLCGCAGDGAAGGGFWYEGVGYYDSWYWDGGCCADAPDVIGPPNAPHPEHPIANVPDGRPSQPIANPPRPAPVARPMAAPRPAARGGGGRR
jgi:hypothetical protein